MSATVAEMLELCQVAARANLLTNWEKKFIDDHIAWHTNEVSITMLERESLKKIFQKALARSL